MPFAELRGGGLSALGLPLLALQVYNLFSSSRQPDTSSCICHSGRTDCQVHPWNCRLFGATRRRVFDLFTKERGTNEESQPVESKSGFAM
jgi:hypothetical protein